MKTKTKFLGEVDTGKEQVLTFPAGLAGMAHRQRFILLRREEIRPFYWLQSVEDGDFLLPVVEPTPFFPDYRVVVSEGEVQNLGMTDTADGLVLCIVTLESDPMSITANLQGPLVVNRKNGLGRQVILIDNAFTAREDLLEAGKSGICHQDRLPEGEILQIKKRR
ncbi:MAG: flagellar assembly protein FliW [bacterium]|nr:flagellar assembly protein FliW [bacterium]